MAQWMAQWIPVLVLLAPVGIKVIQLRVLRVGGDGLIYMEFESFFKARSEKPRVNGLTRKLRKQVKQ